MTIRRGRAVCGQLISPLATIGKPLPAFIIIGVQKAGTTSLTYYLRRHAQTIESKNKELHYFTHHYDGFQGSYRRMFKRRSGGRSFAFEATPYYLFHPAVPARVARMLPHCKLIVLLRDPVARAFSHWRHQVSKGREPLSFDDAVAAEPERLAGEEARLADDPGYTSFNHQRYSYVSRGFYAPQIGRWLDHFPREQLLALESEALRTHPLDQMRRIERFVGLRAHDYTDWQEKNVGRGRVTLDTETATRLRERYEADGQKLQSLLGFTPSWLQLAYGLAA